jgi:hypothetical protein
MIDLSQVYIREKIMEIFKEIILLGIGACLPIIFVTCIIYGIWRSFTARHEYISGVVHCTDKYKDKADTYLPMKIGGFPNLINIDNTDHISIFQYGNKEIKAENKDIYELGLIQIDTPMGNKVKAYDMERCICDIIRSKNRMDSEHVKHSIREYVKRKDKDLVKLSKYAEKLGVKKEVMDYVEAFYE